MQSRRQLLIGASALLATPLIPSTALAHHTKKKKRRGIAKRFLPQNVKFTGHPPGRIIIDRKNFYLYWTMPNGRARRYGVGLGKAGLQLNGTTRIAYKKEWPSWTPTKNMIKRNPRYAKYAGGMPGGPGNPLGARALYLYRGGRDTLFRIHGTTAPWTIGSNKSNGCVRMINDHVIDLYKRVPAGTLVKVIS